MSVRLNKFHLKIPDQYKPLFESGRSKMCSTSIRVQASGKSGGYFLADVQNSVRLSRICSRCLNICDGLRKLPKT